MKRRVVIKWVSMYAVILWGGFAFLMLIGDDPEDSMSLGRFFIIKAIGMANLIASILVGYYAAARGYFPSEEEIEKVFGKE